ncbi:MAG TPA: type II secretion system protein GspC [Polyangiaceae bacterium]|nr:type II secretion system protein GspC [Polyangiaceae bacterium]
MAFDTVLKRYFAGVILALIAVAAYFQASGITQLVGSALSPDEKALVGSSQGAGRATAAPASSVEDHATSARWILERNPFDSVTPRPLDAPPVVDAGAGAEVIDLEHYENAPPCDGVKALIIVAAADPAWSMAVLSGGAPATKLVRVGDEINGKTVQIVEWNRVVLSTGSSLCQLQMFKPSKAPAVAAASPTPPPTPMPAPGAAAVVGGASAVPAEIASKIQKVSANEFNVDRQVVDKILENQAELMRSARIVPEQENGKVVGIRLFGIRPDTLLGTLGLENGDRLQTINGFDMASPEKALEAYARLRTADHLTVQVNRRGANQNIDFNIK